MINTLFVNVLVHSVIVSTFSFVLLIQRQELLSGFIVFRPLTFSTYSLLCLQCWLIRLFGKIFYKKLGPSSFYIITLIITKKQIVFQKKNITDRLKQNITFSPQISNNSLEHRRQKNPYQNYYLSFDDQKKNSSANRYSCTVLMDI